MASFILPVIEDNPEGWGPVSSPEEFRDLPYAAFSKSERLGNAADWYMSRNRRGNDNRGNAVFSLSTADEGSFQVIDTRFRARTAGFRGGAFSRGGRRDFSTRNTQSTRGGYAARRGGRPTTGGRYGSWRDEKPRRIREPTVEILPEYQLEKEVVFNQFADVSFSPVKVEDLAFVGSLEYYKKSFDMTVSKSAPILRPHNRNYYPVTTSEDPLIQKFAEEDKAQVFATDSILSLLMATTRSVYPWDLIVVRSGNKVFFDKRPNSAADYFTGHENADSLYEEKEGINSADNLTEEATRINRIITQALLDPKQKKELEQPNPFVDASDEVPSIGYRYRSFDMGSYNLIARCEIDSITTQRDNELYINIRAVNEVDQKVSGNDWRRKVDTQRGAVMATEFKNNGHKLSRWALQSLLSGADQLKIGFVTRTNPKDNQNHVLLGVQFYKPQDFANQINLNVQNSWGIVKALTDVFLELPEGKYLLTRDPNKSALSLYSVPDSAFEGGDDDEAALD